jgi:hypothetical protein
VIQQLLTRLGANPLLVGAFRTNPQETGTRIQDHKVELKRQN